MGYIVDLILRIKEPYGVPLIVVYTGVTHGVLVTVLYVVH